MQLATGSLVSKPAKTWQCFSAEMKGKEVNVASRVKWSDVEVDETACDRQVAENKAVPTA